MTNQRSDIPIVFVRIVTHRENIRIVKEQVAKTVSLFTSIIDTSIDVTFNGT
jgi:hypothetical protein